MFGFKKTCNEYLITNLNAYVINAMSWRVWRMKNR